MYTVVEGKEPIVTMCVEMFSGELTDIVSLSYSVSLQSVSATGKNVTSLYLSW